MSRERTESRDARTVLDWLGEQGVLPPEDRAVATIIRTYAGKWQRQEWAFSWLVSVPGKPTNIGSIERLRDVARGVRLGVAMHHKDHRDYYRDVFSGLDQ